jgi:hypothetical protein
MQASFTICRWRNAQQIIRITNHLSSAVVPQPHKSAPIVDASVVEIYDRYFHAQGKDTVRSLLFRDCIAEDHTQTFSPRSFYSSGINRRPVCPITYDI